MSLIIGVDACRNRSGGAKAYLRGIMQNFDPVGFGVKEVHLWSYQALLDDIPDEPWLVKHCPSELNGSLLAQLWWQATKLRPAAQACGCDILFVTDGSTVGRYRPMVVFSQDLLSYEPGIIQHYGWSRARLRIWAILHVQNWAFRAASGVIFLTRYTEDVIKRSSGPLHRTVCIPHGVDDKFRGLQRTQPWPSRGERAIECLYVSNTAMYKNQWHVDRAIGLLRAQGYNLKLTLVGGGQGVARHLVDDAMAEVDPKGEFIQLLEYLPHRELPAWLARADLFVFASACETFGITLLEAMSAGLPIACSNRSSLPELLEDGGVYFDPTVPSEIAAAMKRIVDDCALRSRIATRARQLSDNYSWRRCAAETWKFVVDTAHEFKNERN